MQPVRILILAARLQPFLLANVKALLQKEQVSVLLIHWPGTGETPLPSLPSHFLRLETIQKDKGSLTAAKKILAFEAHIVLAPGWMDKDYLGWTRQERERGATTIMSMDNQWLGTVRQRINKKLRGRLHQIYHKAWVPGARQYEYARLLGFDDVDILSGYYTPDVSLFHHYFKTIRKLTAPKVFLYAGRLVDHKLKNLLEAFHSIKAERSGWKLLIAGDGPLSGHALMKDEDIICRPYMPQEALRPLIEDSSVFCLTSENEAWGTAIQEYAIAGMPLLVSRQCGAMPHFLIDGFNGFACEGSVESIAEGMKRFIRCSDKELIIMGQRSHEIGSTFTNEVWADNLITLASPQPLP